MPATLTYPGVYIEEIPSGVRTIMGVPTSITAFVGKAKRGPVNEPITINGFGEFERTFGGLWKESEMSYAVRDYYLNGGSQAIIVRIINGAEKAELTKDGIDLQAANEGAWGSALRIRIDKNISEDIAKRYNDLGFSNQVGKPLVVGDFFNLMIRDTKSNILEEFRNLTVADTPNRIDRVLKNESRLFKVKENNGAPQLPTTTPTAHEDIKNLPKKADVWDDNPNNLFSTGASKPGLDGNPLTTEFILGKESDKTGIYSLNKTDLFNLLCLPLPPATDDNLDDRNSLMGDAAKYCADRRAMLIVDPPQIWNDKQKALEKIEKVITAIAGNKKNAAIFFPHLKESNPLKNNQIEEFVPCGAVAGVFARIDTQRGVWKAPAGLEAALTGVFGLKVSLTDAENGELNPRGINCIRSKPPAGNLIWGARTLDGDDRLASEWKYIPIRRLALFIEESLFRGTQWVVFEPNDEPLWAQIRLNVGAFMHSLFRQGAFQGSSPKEAYFVRCDSETTTQTDRNMGIVNILVGFAPLKPAEFVVIKIQQMAGQIET